MTSKTKKQIEYTLDTMAIENLVPSDDAVSLCEQISDGRITVSSAVSALLEKYGVSKNA